MEPFSYDIKHVMVTIRLAILNGELSRFLHDFHALFEYLICHQSEYSLTIERSYSPTPSIERVIIYNLEICRWTSS